MAQSVTEQLEHFWGVSSPTREIKGRRKPDNFRAPGHVIGSGGPSSVEVETSETSQPPPTQLEPERPKNGIPTTLPFTEGVRNSPAPDELADPLQELPPFPSTMKETEMPTAPLTTENVGRLNEEEAVKHGKTFKPYVRPVATPNERLAQARIFLSDEDIYCDRDFAERWSAIDNFMRKLSDEKIEVDLKIYDEVKAMLWVHKQRMDKVDQPDPPSIEFETQFPPFSLRLPSDHPAAKEEAEIVFRREDHPPFTVERKPDHLEFLHAFRGNNVIGKELRTLESKAYFATLKDPKLVNQKARVETFQTRATQRGSRRAAIQTALRTLARNTEQHYRGDWVNRVITLPQPVPEIPEPVMSMALPEDERPKSPDPFECTKKYQKYESEQRNVEILQESGLKHQVRENYLKLLGIAQPLSSEPLPSDPAEAEKKAISLIRDKILLENHLDHRPRNLDHAALWSFVSEIPDEYKNRAFFHLDRSSGWEKPAEAQSPEPLQLAYHQLDQDPTSPVNSFEPDGQTRTYHAVPYTSLDPESTAPSYRLPPEEIGLVLVKEDAGPPTLKAGTGALMPPEIANFDHARDGHMLEGATDPLEKRWSNRPAEMPFPETAIAQARMNREIEKHSKRGLATEPEQDFESEAESEMFDSLETQIFKLPEIAEDLDLSVLRKATNIPTTKPTNPSKKRSHKDFASDIINTIVANEIRSSPQSPSAPSPEPETALRSHTNPSTPSPTSPQTRNWMEKLLGSPSVKKFKDSHSTAVPV
ncbi:MAG: hypothetical protein M1835_002154 [Candelina submexicana]|nr:MAG: hypothetical protein M1835_002154 [Candelina submexicana]